MLIYICFISYNDPKGSNRGKWRVMSSTEPKPIKDFDSSYDRSQRADSTLTSRFKIQDSI